MKFKSIECKSYHDLIGCFELLYKAVRNETFKPLVYFTFNLYVKNELFNFNILLNLD